jgi:cbb3-type cytochrome oxidase subunit 1
MWQALNADGSLAYPNFIQTLTPNYPFWNMRTMGGVIFFAGFLVFVYNIYKTIKQAPAPQKA